eukprot:TRINITY_DN6205_c0_g1_i1.p1 TRINITY_DN6205_c0_g1~~TRINITY_DN6205_c0_g1_i1.p1  ORF type:complete len:199 (+),score=8.37 TRINITY_DN6205_c0_g1_i1:123-719(+)
MRASFFALLSFAASAVAYRVTSPSTGTKWYGGAVTNKLTWERVNTDPEQFTLVLVNEDRSLLPVNNQQLIATVPGSIGTIDVPAPSGGFPVGTNFQVNLVQSTTNVSTIYAQSPRFDIVTGTSTVSGTSTVVSGSVSMSAALSRTSLVVSQTPGSPTSTASDINETGAASGSTNGAMSLVARASPLLGVVAVLAAFIA